MMLNSTENMLINQDFFLTDPEEANVFAKRILLVDDEEATLVLLQTMLERAGYTNVIAINDSRKVNQVFSSFSPDLILLDVHMPHMDGFAVLKDLEPLIEDAFLPVMVLTSDKRAEVRQRALAEGARDYLTKPFDKIEVELRIKNLLETRCVYLELQQQNQQLEHRIQERTQKLEETQIEMLVRLARAAEYRDDESGEHVWRVAHNASRLAQELNLPYEKSEMLLRAARLHDVGKIAIPDGILLKPAKLTAAEFEVIKSHTTVGAQLLSGGQSPLMKMAELIALTHHERWDGIGYPQGLQGKQIPIESRILAVVDTFDALTHDRAHQKAQSVPEAIFEIERQRAKQFDPSIVDALLTLYERGELIS